jgi:DNA repair protein SbcD/Mre11
MKILHTSDWHLGKKLFKEDRLEEQILFLNWLEKSIKKENIDILVIAGDIFDTPHPPSEALKSYFLFLKNIVENTDCEVFILAGNHDNGKFLEAPSPFLKENKIHLVGKFQSGPSHFEIIKGKEKALINLVPYFRPYEILAMQDDDLLLPEDIPIKELLLLKLKQFISKLYKKEEKAPQLLFTHHLVGEFWASGSEQGIGLAGLDSLPTSLFENLFDYVGLGHIHRPQVIKKEKPLILYSGSPLPLRFSEKEEKQYSLITIHAGKIKQEFKPIPTFRSLYSWSLNQSTWKEDFLKKWEQTNKNNSGNYETNLDTFLELVIHLDGPQMNLIDDIRNFLAPFPIKLLSFQALRPEQKKNLKRDLTELDMSVDQLFKMFLKDKFPENDTTVEKQDFQELLSTFSELTDLEYKCGEE